MRFWWARLEALTDLSKRRLHVDNPHGVRRHYDQRNSSQSYPANEGLATVGDRPQILTNPRTNIGN
jgi:hypothetical protein